jgi:hypothetical protein
MAGRRGPRTGTAARRTRRRPARRTGQAGDVVAQPAVGRQLLGEHLGEATAEHEARRARWQLLVPQRVDDGDVGAGRGQQLGGLGVEKVNAAPPATATTGRSERDETGAVHGSPSSGGADRATLRIASRSRLRAHSSPRRRTVATAAGARSAAGHQPEVTARGRHLVVASQHAEHLGPAVERLAQQLLVAVAADPVEHHARHLHVAVGGEAVHERGHRAGHGGGVDDQDDGRAEQRGDVRRRPLRRAATAVEQPHHALDHGDVGAARTVQEQRAQALGPDQHRVEVAAGAAGREGVVAGVDVVGADLVGADPQPAGGERRHEPGRDGRLAGAGGRGATTSRAGRHGGHHSIPRWPFWPASIGCLTLVVSSTRSAASTSAGAASGR